MSSTKSNSVPTPESVHDVWLSQRTELERDLFDGWVPEVRSVPTVAPSQPVTNSAKIHAPIPVLRTQEHSDAGQQPSAEQVAVDHAQHQERLKRSQEAAVQQRVQDQRRVTEGLSQQRDAFVQDMARQRAVMEQELATREAAWATQRDQEWMALQSAKEVQDVAQKQLKDEISTQRVREREELSQWRRQAEIELAEARRLFEQERLKQQQEFGRQREMEMTRLRRDREELDARVRQVQSELAYARQRQEEELRRLRDVQTAQMRVEREELDKLRETWLDKFHREQVVLENGLRFFGDHLSRVSEELRVAQRGLQAVSESATEAHPTALLAEPALTDTNRQPAVPSILSLDEIRERLNDLKQPRRAVA